MKRLRAPFYLGAFTAVLCLLAVAVFAGVKVHAIDDLGPDKNEFGGANVYYELSNTSDVISKSMLVPFYYPTRPTSAQGVAVTCGDGGGNVKVDYKRPSDGALIPIDGDLCNGNFSIPVAAFPTTEDANTGYFEAKIVLSLTDGTVKDSNYKAFKFNILDTAKIGYSADNTNASHFAVANLNRCDQGLDSSGCGVYHNYALPFAPPCSLASNSSTITILDPDNPSGSDKYGIQPSAFSIKLVETNKDGTVTNANVNIYPKTVLGATSTNQELDTYHFNFKQGHNYQLKLSGVYSNNVIQFGLPFDSINYDVPCLAGTASGVTGGCKGITGYIYDKYDHPNNAAPYIAYYTAINPAAGDPQTSYSSYTALAADLDLWPGGTGTANKNTPAADTNGNGVPDLYGHGFTIPAPPAGYRSHRYSGPWQPNTYVVYGREAGTNTIHKIKTVSVGICATVSCSSSYTNFAVGPVNQDVTFHVWMKTNTYADTPLPDPTFTIRVDSPSKPNVVYNTAVTANLDNPADQVYSNNVTFKPTEPGTYKVYWSYNGVSSGCSTSDRAGYSPYFSVLGGDIAAGAGFGNGSCSETGGAGIRSWNTNSGTYDGAGTQIGALATGDITDFVSGLGLSGGANAGALNLKGHGLSFANDSPPAPPSYGGQFNGGLACVHDYASDATASDPVLASLDRGTAAGVYKYSSNTLGSGSDIIIDPGKTITLYVTGDVYIKNNILYDSSYDLTNVPRFNLYVTGSIYIDPGVTELHGVYVAQKGTTPGSGAIITCATGIGAELRDSGCDSKLLFVGAVAADTINLDRTHGSLVADPAANPAIPAEPAETFQYSPELWLSGSPVPSLKYQAFTSLPPVL